MTRFFARPGLPRLLPGLAVLLVGAVLSACGGGGGASGDGGATAGGSTTGSSGGSTAPSDPPPAAATMRVHYYRPDGVYTNWGVYAWQGPRQPSTGWPGNRFVFNTADADGWGEHVDMAMDATQTRMLFLITLPNATNSDASKDCASNQQATLNASLASSGQEIWVVSGDCTVYTQEPGKVSIAGASAIWLTADTLVWPGAPASASYTLVAASTGGLKATATGLSGQDASVALTVAASGFAGLPAAVQSRYPQYAGATVLKLPAAISGATLASLLSRQLVVAQSSGGALAAATQPQLAPVLDALYGGTAQAANLGLSFANEVPSFALWAPTAQAVTLNIFDGPDAGTPSATQPLSLDSASGIWRFTAPDAGWTNQKYYSYTVKVYSRAAPDAVVNNTVVDPYAPSLNALDRTQPASLKGMVLNLADAAAKPGGWDAHVQGGLLPTLDGTDSVIYELHLRDYSASDASVPAAQQGRYEAFSSANAGQTAGMKHLQALAQAGLSHVHLLPLQQFASVDELHCSTQNIAAGRGADLAAEQAVIASQGSDCFNWGYDPLVYGVPEGVYSSTADQGATRVREFRDMVMGLHGLGLRVIMDVVYNHSPAAGQDPFSLLDRIVPGYYYRLDAKGNPTNQSGAGADLAVENSMTQKLVIDSLLRFADQYKVDGFRFDIMSLLPRQALLDIQSALNAVVLADGRRASASAPGMYLYGEGWTQSGLAFVNAQQSNLAGTGIGSFNDRLRDAVRGGSPFDSGASMVSHQGFINGLCYANNDGSACNTSTPSLSWCGSGMLTQQQCLLLLQNRIAVGLAGNLASFPLNATTTGAQLDYFGGPTGYTAAPQENLVYASVHDNETLFDLSQYRLATSTSASDRARVQLLGLSLVALAQGVPFFQAGDELLRSKSMDSNSYDSGDYFNRIDWTDQQDNWAVGAPPQNTGNNAANLATMGPLLGNAALQVGATDIAQASAMFQDLLRLRRDTSMFRLKTAAAINSCVSFPDQGAQQPGLIVMRISGAAGCGDQKYASVLVMFNASAQAQSLSLPAYVARSVMLHPLQAAGSDPVVKAARFAAGQFTVPARSTAVFVEP